MKAMSSGIRVPDGIMAAYPATLLTTDASPSRLLTLIDPLLPLGVLTKCVNAYAGMCGPPWHVSGCVLFHASFGTSVLAVTTGKGNKLAGGIRVGGEEQLYNLF